MSTTNPAAPDGVVHFQVVAIERFSLPDPVREEHMVLRVHYLNPEDALRGATFDLPPETYATYRDSIDAALTTGATYWVAWDTSVMAPLPHRRGTTAADRLLQAIAANQLVSSDAGQE